MAQEDPKTRDRNRRTQGKPLAPANPPLPSSEHDDRFVANWHELGDRLGVTRRAIQEWRKDPRYKEDCPPDRADGRKEVAAWAAFIQKHGLKNADQHAPNVPDDENGGTVIMAPRIAGSQSDWKSFEIKLKCDQRQIELEEKRRNLLSSAELELPLGTAFAAITNRLNQLPEILAPLVTGQMDVQDVMEIIRPEAQATLRALGVADFDTELEALLNDPPQNEETERLFRLVSFEGQDRPAFLELMRHLCRAVLSRIGKKCIEKAVSPLAIHDVHTGQSTPEAAQEVESLRRIAEQSPVEPPGRESAPTAVSKAKKARRSSPKPKTKPRKKK